MGESNKIVCIPYAIITYQNNNSAGVFHVMTDQQILTIVFGSIGLFLILISLMIYTFGVAVKKKKCTNKTTGIVVDKVRGSDNNLYPVIEYSVDGTVYRRKKNVTAHGSINNGYPFGYELDVLYDPDKPKRCLIGGTKVQTIAAFIPGFIGMVFFVIGVVIFLF